MSSVHVKCITMYTREVSLTCECTQAVLSILVKCVFMHAYTSFKENAQARTPKLRVKVDYLRNIMQKVGESTCVFTCECKVKLELYRMQLSVSQDQRQ